MNEKHMDIGDELVSAIQQSDLSLREISRRSGVDIATICRWINYSYTPSLRNAYYVFSVLGLKLTVVSSKEEGMND